MSLQVVETDTLPDRQGTDLSNLHLLKDDVSHQITFTNVFELFWTNSSVVSSLCDECGDTFDDERGPSIRTFSAVETFVNEHDGAITHIRVHNRHRKCIQQATTSYIPVSHVWHEPVRAAHESGLASPEAAVLAMDTPLKILRRARLSFGPGIEIWHDYLSVPQWRFEIQQQILLLIPAIYHMPTRVIVHLEDYDPKHIKLLVDYAAILDSDPKSADMINQRYEAVLEFYKSRWAKRVWVTLEFASSRRTCIMDSQDQIWRVDGAHTGSFVKVYDEARRNYIMVYDYFVDRRAFLESIRYVSRAQDTRFAGLSSLGDTLDNLASRNCKYHRDRFLAVYATLGVDVYETNATMIPKDAAGACRWVWLQAMQTGDYSPLLLQPNGDRENEAFNLSWLVGHELVNFHTWDMGRPLSSPIRPQIIRNGVIEPELDYVGIVESINWTNVADDMVEGLIAVILLFLKLPDHGASNLIRTLERIYPVHLFCTRYAEWEEAGYSTVPRTTEEYVSENPDIESQLGALIQGYTVATQEERPSARVALATEITRLLQLDKQFGPMKNDTRLRDATKRAKQRRVRDGMDEPICAVRCELCQTISLHKLDLRLEVGVGAVVYRIPGLCYTATIEDGVGLVMQGRRVVGRTRYNIPCCSCRQSKLVRIE